MKRYWKDEMRRCWNCASYNTCTDYRTFAYGCLCCGEHKYERNPIQWWKNISDYVRIKPPAPSCEDTPIWDEYDDDDEWEEA